MRLGDAGFDEFRPLWDPAIRIAKDGYETLTVEQPIPRRGTRFRHWTFCGDGSSRGDSRPADAQLPTRSLRAWFRRTSCAAGPRICRRVLIWRVGRLQQALLLPVRRFTPARLLQTPALRRPGWPPSTGSPSVYPPRCFFSADAPARHPAPSGAGEMPARKRFRLGDAPAVGRNVGHYRRPRVRDALSALFRLDRPADAEQLRMPGDLVGEDSCVADDRPECCVSSSTFLPPGSCCGRVRDC